MIHELHFVVNENLYKKLNQLSKKLVIQLPSANICTGSYSKSRCTKTKTNLNKKQTDLRIMKKNQRKRSSSLSKTIVYIFEQMNTFLEKNHLLAMEKDSQYKLIANLDEERVHIHCYMPEDLYRKLKLIHHDLNVYSLAQILRKMIIFFLMGCSKYGVKKLNTRLDKIKKIWENKKVTYKQKKEIFIRQLNYELKRIYYCRTTYGLDSRPYLIQFIK